jgi:hypothetical protein
MKRTLAHSLLFFMGLSGCAMPSAPPKEARTPLPVKTWAVYYDTKLPADAFKDYDLVIFDRRHYPDLAPLKALSERPIVLAYVSIGEVYDDVDERKLLEEENALLFKNERWNSHAVDLRAKRWRAIVHDKVDDAMEKGFDGVMLDTLDSPLHHAAQEGEHLATAMQTAGVQLVKSLRRHHPDARIMLNRGFEALPELAPILDFVLAESILAQRDVSTGQYKLFPPDTYGEVVTQLRQAKGLAPHLQILTLDYWSMDDGDTIAKLYAIQRKHGFVPYVTTPDLRQHTPEPAARRTLPAPPSHLP